MNETAEFGHWNLELLWQYISIILIELMLTLSGIIEKELSIYSLVLTYYFKTQIKP